VLVVAEKRLRRRLVGADSAPDARALAASAEVKMAVLCGHQKIGVVRPVFVAK